MIGSELIAELDESSYNLNTSPWTVSNLQGNLYDYHFFAFCDSGSTTSGRLEINLNSDTGSNYSRYIMYGLSSTASASKNTHTEMRVSSFTRNQSSRNSLAYGSLTGSSGDNRKLHIVSSSGYDPQINIHDFYWTNTADEVDEITFTGSTSASYKWHIAVYRTPKESVQGTWEYMDKLEWSSESTEKSFTGLDGDLHKQYKVTWEGDLADFRVELNNDNGSNYTRQQLRNSSGTLSASNATSTYLGVFGLQGELIINAESGVDRLCYTSVSSTASSQQRRLAEWWQDTSSNLVSIDCRPNSSATGTAKLYRRINPTITADIFPFETIKTFDVSGDYSSGDTLSGLTCDDYKLIKIEWLGEGTTNLRIQYNSDTGTNYHHQRLKGTNSSTLASSYTFGYHVFKGGADVGEQSYAVTYIYPKSGEYRPTLTKRMDDEDSIVFEGQWWLNSADEINSIKTYASSTSSMSGQIKISVLR